MDGRSYTPPPPTADNKMMPRNRSFAARWGDQCFHQVLQELVQLYVWVRLLQTTK